jgi:ribonuclease E
MAKRMLIDAAHPEETRVVVLNGNRLEEFDFETSIKKQIKGNIYLAKVTRVEPSLQAAFVEYGGNRHGFLAFSEIHPDYYRIPVSDRHRGMPARHRRDEKSEEGGEDGYNGPAESGEADAGDRAAYAGHGEESHEGDERDFGHAEEHLGHEHQAYEYHREQHGDEHPGEGDQAEHHGGEDRGAGDFEARHAGDEHEETGESRGGASEEPSPSDHWADDATAQHPSASGEPGSIGEDALHASSEPDHRTGETTGRELAERHEDGSDDEQARADTIETLGGDEIEEAARQRIRPLRHYKIQEVIKRRQIMLVQVTKEERGTKGAALTTYLSLAGRYCVLMPNTPRGGGVSRKITNTADRRRLKELMSDLEVPEGMGVIVRTAGSERSKAEIKRDFEYLIRLWDEIRELTLKSTAPALIYEEGNLIKRSIRDLYSRDIEEVIVDGEEGYRTAKAFMKMLMPSHAKRVKPYHDPTVPLFHRFQVESQIDAIHSPVVQLRSGGYIVINPTEALVAIDVNSGRSTKERNIEETAVKTNQEAAEEIARQLRLRDLAGLIVIDFIDMEETRNQLAVERRLKDAMRFDRARIQIGRISPFGLLELSRQRLRPSLLEASTQPCPHCNGTGHIRSTESTALHVLRAIEEEGMRRRSAEINVAVPTVVALYILNQKRDALAHAEARYFFRVSISNDDTLVPPAFRLERLRALTPAEVAALPIPVAPLPEPEEEEEDEDERLPEDEEQAEVGGAAEEAVEEAPGERAEGERAEGEDGGRKPRRRRRRSRDEPREALPPNMPMMPPPFAPADLLPSGDDYEEHEAEAASAGDGQPAEGQPAHGEAGEATDEEGDAGRKRRRRGRRGGRRRRRSGPGPDGLPLSEDESGGPEGDEHGEDHAAMQRDVVEAEFVEVVPENEIASEAAAAAPVAEALAGLSAPLPATTPTECVPVAEPGDPLVEAAAPDAAAPAHAAPEPRHAESQMPAAVETAVIPDRQPAAEPAETAPAEMERPAEGPAGMSEAPAAEPVAAEPAPDQVNVPPAQEVTGRPVNPSAAGGAGCCPERRPRRGPRVHGRHGMRRRAASAMASVAPAKEKRSVAWPRAGSKSIPGVQATPVSRSMRRQNAWLSLVRCATSA